MMKQIARLAPMRNRLEKLLDLMSRGAGILRRVAPGQGMGTGDQQIVDPSRMGNYQFEVVVDQAAGIKELKRGRAQNDTAGSPSDGQ